MQKTIHDERYRALVRWLRDGREEKGLSMRAVAQKLGVPHSWIGKIEQRERRLDLLEYIQLCVALNLRPQQGLALLVSGSHDNPMATAPTDRGIPRRKKHSRG